MRGLHLRAAAAAPDGVGIERHGVLAGTHQNGAFFRHFCSGFDGRAPSPRWPPHRLGYNYPKLKVPIRDRHAAETRPAAPRRKALDLPPAFRLVTLREVGDAFAHAKANAAELGAGTLVFVGRFDLAEFAVVLEPDEPLRDRAPRVLCRHGGAGRCAGRPRAAREADRVRLAGRDPRRSRPGRRRAARLARRAGGRAAAMAGVRRHDPHRSMAEGEPGLRPLSAALEEEGFDESARPAGRKLRAPSDAAVDAWQEFGFAEVAKNYLGAARAGKGVRRDIDENGDLLVRRMGKAEVERRSSLPRSPRRPGSIPRPGAACVKLLRTIRLDPSDTFVFERAAEPGEWAVTGTFMFCDDDPEHSKARRARRSARAFSACSLGWSTLVQIVEASDDDRLAAIDALAKQFVAHFGAPEHRGRGRGGRRGIRVRRLALQSPARHADCHAPQLEAAKSARPSARCAPRTARSRSAPSRSSRWRARRSRPRPSISRPWPRSPIGRHDRCRQYLA